MTLEMVPARVATSPDEEGRLVYEDGRLVAVLVRLSALHGPEAGGWFLEAAFGPAQQSGLSMTFPDLDQARTWFTGRSASPP